MGGCCGCASKNTELHRSPPFFHYTVPEEHEPLPTHCATVPVLSSELLVDANLDFSVPDTYQPPPAPIPYEKYPGCPPASSENQEGSGNKAGMVLQIADSESTNDPYCGSTMETKVKTLEFDEKSKLNADSPPSEKLDDEKSSDIKKSIEPIFPPLQDEEDICPTCFEEYDEENPKIIAKCDHHFHLGCILEWMERSDTCPMCDQKMVFSLGEGG
ncbi:probable E3 ubiquitin-protein ligase RHB1A [Andrographis paniculata]|uniref:probable E3 ubiquitin-protein ligase RHB1A n=1 Tax=Andrographis paniculata TaxID=175694 RepID=UPI0021E8A186|nr:probable E3 ubiquitin-protein ligase RHB1A [Andrographis paniculata]